MNISPREGFSEEDYLRRAVHPLASLTREEAGFALSLVNLQVAKCARCEVLASSRIKTVFGVGNPKAELCFVGEAPGGDEDAQGEPFVGAAGQLLNKILKASGFQRDEVYICNIVKCRPPKNRKPQPNEIGNCAPYLQKQIAIIRPRVICCLGSVAAQVLLETTSGVTQLRGKVYEFRGIPVHCTFHPAYLLRNPDAKRDVWEDMKNLVNYMGRQIPERPQPST